MTEEPQTIMKMNIMNVFSSMQLITYYMNDLSHATLFWRQQKTNLALVLSYLEELGYTCRADKLKASDYGVPQRRTRYYIFGLRHVSNFAESSKALIEHIESRLHACRSVNVPIDTSSVWI